ALGEFASICDVVDQKWKEYERVFEEGVRKTSQEIREIASNERFREAIVWQNHNALHTGIDPMLSKDLSSNRDSKDRRNEEMIATYWQRYCVKNDTIGYFGPVGWARIVEEGKAIEVKAGKELVKERKTYFETWCIDEVAQMLGRDKEIRKWLAPRLAATVRMDGERVEMGVREEEVREEERKVMSKCDGKRTGEEVAEEAMKEGEGKGREEVYEVLEELERRKIINWGISVASSSHPEKELIEEVKRIKDEGMRKKCEGVMERLEEGRRKIEEAAGSAEELDKAMHEMEERFEEETGKRGRRHEGRMYAGRTLVYEDSRRDVEVKIGKK